MYNKQIENFILFNFSKVLNKKNSEKVAVDEVCYLVQISFNTNGQIRYLDEDGRPRIVEFDNNYWTKTLLFSGNYKTSLSVFINNVKLKKDQVVTLIKKVNGLVVNQKSFAVLGEKMYDGWFMID